MITRPQEGESGGDRHPDRRLVGGSDLGDQSPAIEPVEQQFTHLDDGTGRVTLPAMGGGHPPAEQGGTSAQVELGGPHLPYTPARHLDHPVDREETVFSFCATVDPPTRRRQRAIGRRCRALGDLGIVPCRDEGPRIISSPGSQCDCVAAGLNHALRRRHSRGRR